MKLFVLRHGQAESYASSDAARQLTPHGRDEVREVVERSAAEMADLREIITSPLLRARQTAALAQEVLGPPGQVRLTVSDLLIPESTPGHVVEMLQAADDGNYLLVSHQPLVGELVSGLCGKANGYHPMGTASLACIELEVAAMGCGQLLWLR